MNSIVVKLYVTSKIIVMVLEKNSKNKVSNTD